MTGLRAIGSDLDPGVVLAIDRQLASIEAAERVRILLAVESGSRAWGFPSPDSDYDCRFIYVRRSEDYLSLFPPRDVIEVTPDRVHDTNGWDLAKALRLLLKGNVVVIEWLTSPQVYCGDRRFREEARSLARQVARPEAVSRHYLHFGERLQRAYFANPLSVPLKKLLYVLRPAVALRWLRQHPGEAIAPMHLPTLLGETDLPAESMAPIEELLARKARTRELGRGALPAPLASLIEEEFALARARSQSAADKSAPAAVEAANAFFRRWLGAWE